MARSITSPRMPTAHRPALTHFLCLPLINPISRPQIEASLDAFRSDVSPALVSPKAVRPVGAIHCTLGVMSLDHDKLQAAMQTLAELDIADMLRKTMADNRVEVERDRPSSLISKSIKIRLKGLASMHDSDHTSILYIPPTDGDQTLLHFCQAIQKVFLDKDLLVKDNRPLKLHATIVNTIYAKEKKPRYSRRQHTSAPSSSSVPDSSTGHGPSAKSLLKFDARPILEEYDDFVWADDFMLDRIAICEMGAKKKFNDQDQLIDEEYTEVAHLALPT